MTEVPDEPYDPNPVAPYPPPSQYPPYGPYPQNPPYPPYPYGGYPPNGWYPGLWNDPRPSAVLGSAVVAYIGAGLLVLAGILLFFGATVVSAFSDTAGDSYRILTTELLWTDWSTWSPRDCWSAAASPSPAGPRADAPS